MRSIFLSLFVSIGVASISGQIPNNGFENWNNTSGYYDLNNWGTLNSVTTFSGIYTATRQTPGMVGTYYLDITSRDIPGKGIVPGVVVSGIVDTATYSPVSGFPFTGRPSALIGKWQYMGFGADTGYISVFLYKWNASTSSRDTIAFVKHLLTGMEMSWTDMFIPITYVDISNPDSCLIVLSSSGSTPYEESFLYIDEIEFTGFSGQATINDPYCLIYPNPATHFVNLQFNSNDYIGAQVEILDLTGKKILAQRVTSPNEILDVSSLSAGTYFISVQSTQATTIKKIIIN